MKCDLLRLMLLRSILWVLFLPIFVQGKKIADKAPKIEVKKDEITQIEFTENIEKVIVGNGIDVEYTGRSAFIRPGREGRVFFLTRTYSIPIEFYFSEFSPAKYEIYPPEEGFEERKTEKQAIPVYEEISAILSHMYNKKLLPGYNRIMTESVSYKTAKVKSALIGDKYTCLEIPFRAKHEERDFYTPGTVAVAISPDLYDTLKSTAYVILEYNPKGLIEEIKDKEKE
jgi:hypothetical protein